MGQIACKFWNLSNKKITPFCPSEKCIYKLETTQRLATLKVLLLPEMKSPLPVCPKIM